MQAKKRMSAGLSRDVEKKVMAVHPELWKQIERQSAIRMGLDPTKIKLTNQQILAVILVMLKIEGGDA